MKLLLLLLWSLGACVACGGVQSSDALDVQFNAQIAESGRELASDLYARAQSASKEAKNAKSRRDKTARVDYEEEARLWLLAAAVESERVQLEQKLVELRAQEERWSKQLAHDQEVLAAIARDITRYEARAIALRETKRLGALSQVKTVGDAFLDAVLTKVRINLALAQAFGVTPEELLHLRQRLDVVARERLRSAKTVEMLLLDSEVLVGQKRGHWPEPRPGASTELVETAQITGFDADRLEHGVVVRSKRFFKQKGQVSPETLRRFTSLLAAFPHGPVACQVATPAASEQTIQRYVRQLERALENAHPSGRVRVEIVRTKTLSTGATQCHFAAYRGP